MIDHSIYVVQRCHGIMNGEQGFVFNRNWRFLRFEEDKSQRVLRNNLSKWLRGDTDSLKFNRRVRNSLKEDHGFSGINLVKSPAVFPLTGKKINVKPTGEDSFQITGAKWNKYEEGLTGVNQEILTKIALVRNRATGSEEYTAQEMAFMYGYNALAQHLLSDLSKIYTESNRSQNFAHCIDAKAWNLILALESLDYGTITAHMRTFLGSVKMALVYFKSSLEHVDPRCNSIQEIDLLIKKIDSLSRYVEPKPPTMNGWEEKGWVALQELIKALQTTTFGRLLQNPPGDSMLTTLMIQPMNLEQGTEGYKILNYHLRTHFTDCFGLYYEDRENTSLNLSTSERKVSTLTHAIAGDLELRRYNPLYAYQKKTSTHYETVTKNDADREIISKIIDEIGEMMSILQGEPKLSDLLTCLIKSPDYFQQLNAGFTKSVGADDQMKMKVNLLEQLITGKDGKIMEICKNKIQTPDVHSALKPCIDGMQEIEASSNEILRDSSSRAHSTRRQNSTTQINKAKKTLETQFGKNFVLFSAAVSAVEKTEEKCLNDLRAFSAKLLDAITICRDLVEIQENQVTIQSSGESAALMIGLGEAGENILRATMVKLLNNHSDRRCKNLLYGLNLDINIIKQFSKDNKSNFDFKLTKDSSLDEKMLADEFDKANLLAVNMGPELEEKINDENYNYIFGTADESQIGSKKRFRKPSRNSVLIDLGADGCGGKMGLGRAHMHDSLEAVRSAITTKIGDQRITQVCIVHSYGGGSGSGMILPLLQTIKRVLPLSVVWVFSAGDTKTGNASQISQNVTYITSDVLQSHYNALHHEPETITTKDWTKFRSTLRKKQSALNVLWKEIAECFPESFGEMADDIEEEKAAALKEIRAEHAMFSKMGFDTSKEIAADMLPYQHADKFSMFIKNTENFSSGKDRFVKWMKYGEDDGSRTFRLYKDFGSIFKKDKLDEDTYFNTNYAHFRSLANGIDTLTKNKTKGDAERELLNASQGKEFMAITMLGLEHKLPTNGTIKDGFQLKSKVIEYANQMRNYHYTLVEMLEKVKLNLASTRDNLVKHVILSNAHFDTAFASLQKPNADKTYEVYNSTMVDLFINIVHSLVADKDNMNDEDHIQRSSETMDRNDMLMRTKPTVSATVLSLPNSTSLEIPIAYEVSDSRAQTTRTDTVLFTDLFVNRNSPIFNKHNDDDSMYREEPNVEALRSLYFHYLQDKNGLRNFNPWDVISSLESDCASNPLFDTEKKAKDYFSTYLHGLREDQRDDLKLNYRISEEVFVKMVRWLKLLPLEIFDTIYKNKSPEALADWQKDTSDWRKELADFYTPGSIKSPLNEKNRKIQISNMVNVFINDLTNNGNRDLIKLLNTFGIIDQSHLACFPSGIVYDFAPILLFEPTKLTMTLDPKRKLDLQEEEIWKYIEKHPVPVQSFAKNSKRTNYHDMMTDLPPGKKPSDIEWSMEPENDYIQIRSPPDELNTDVPIVSMTPKFFKQFTNLKLHSIQKHPEFSDTTLFEKLIVHSSEITNQSYVRKVSEAPSFRTAVAEMAIYSSPKLMTHDESRFVTVLRTVLLGNYPLSEQKAMKALYEENADLVLSNSELKNIIEHEDYRMTLNSQFSWKEFTQTFKQRVGKVIEIDPKELDRFSALELQLFKLVQKTLNEETPEQPKAILDRLYNKFNRQRKESYGEIDPKSDINFSESDWVSSCLQFARFCSIISNTVFNLERQQNYQNGSLDAGSGVAYAFNGTVDAIRSKSDDFLALINSSSDIQIEKVEQSIQYYLGNYIDGPTRGKPFMMQLDAGPLADITIVSQQAAVTEISEQFISLMHDLKTKKFTFINEPLVHPYSFIRNFLWMSTFQSTWLHSPTDSYKKAFEIPEEVIADIIGQPETIAVNVKGILSGGSFNGVTFPKHDRDMFEQVIDASKPINADEDKAHSSRRLRGQLQVIDMILINYFRSLQNEGDQTKMKDFLRKGNEETMKIYPPSHYMGLFDRRNVDPSEGQTKVKGTSKWVIEEEEEGTKTSDLWLTALKNWILYAKKMADGPESENPQPHINTEESLNAKNIKKTMDMDEVQWE